MDWKEEIKLRKFSDECFQIAISKNVSITCIFNQCDLFNNLIHPSESSIFDCSYKNTHSDVCLKFLWTQNW